MLLLNNNRFNCRMIFLYIYIYIFTKTITIYRNIYTIKDNILVTIMSTMNTSFPFKSEVTFMQNKIQKNACGWSSILKNK